MITYSKQSNNTAGMATDIQINLSGKEEWVTNPTEAFRKSVEFILNNLQGDVPLESVNKWLALNKNDNEKQMVISAEAVNYVVVNISWVRILLHLQK